MSMGHLEGDPAFTDEEIALRMNAAVKKALNTPPTPLKEESRKGKAKDFNKEAYKNSSIKAKIALILAPFSLKPREPITRRTRLVDK